MVFVSVCVQVSLFRWFIVAFAFIGLKLFLSSLDKRPYLLDKCVGKSSWPSEVITSLTGFPDDLVNINPCWINLY